MKKNLLLVAALMIGVGVNAQFDDSNTPQIGTQETLYLLDSNAVDYASETGATAVWDYSATAGYNNTTRAVEMKDVASTSNGSSFTSSDKALVIESLLTGYLTDDASGQKSQGFYMNDATAGEIVAQYDVNEQELYQYPLGLSDNFTDHYEGTFDLDNPSLGIPISGTIAGDVEVSVDGQGDLKLAENTYSNVLRYKLVDHFVLSFSLPLVGAKEIIVDRVQYEYYDFTEGELPIFLHSNIAVDPPSGLGLNASDQTVVLSLEDSPTILGLTSNNMEQTLIYPNPANKVLNIQLAPSMESANITISDALGRQIYTSEIQSAMNTIDVSQFNKGVYFVKIKDGVSSSTKRVIIK